MSEAINPFIEEPTTTATPTPKPKRKPRTGPRGVVSEGNALYLAFASLFPGADAEAFSVLANRKPSPWAPAGELPTVLGTTERLRKLTKLQALSTFKQASTGAILYGASGLGRSYAEDFGYDVAGASSLNGLSFERLTHYRLIAHVAGQFVSPEGFFRESLGVEPVDLAQLITEKTMRVAFAPVKKELEAQKKKGQNSDFGRYRYELLKETAEAIQAKKYSVSDIPLVQPVLLTLGEPHRENSKTKQVHQPDLAVLGRTSEGKRRNILVEVELSKKTWAEYSSILATFKKELSHSYVYDSVAYFTVSPQIETLLRKVDSAENYGLFGSEKLVVQRIAHRDGTLVEQRKRVYTKAEN